MANQNFLIDNLAFAARGEQLQGELPVHKFSRLNDLIASQLPNSTNAEQAGQIKFTLNGEKNVLGQCFLHLTIDARLVTYCQRCLSEMPLSLTMHFHYLISDVGADPMEDVDASIDDDFDIQEACEAMDVKLLIEDEIIMALPISPLHEHGCVAHVMESGEKLNPFAVLKDLIKS